MRILKKIPLLGLILAFSCSEKPAAQKPLIEIYEGIEFNMPIVQEPTFPDYSVSIVDFGGVGDGQFLNTDAFADAINTVSVKGGGTIVIPRGIWLTGPIVLQNNINLHADYGALIIFSTNKDLYPLIETSFEGLKTVRCMSPISGKNLRNIAISGEGIFDGSGDAWRHVKKSKTTEGQWKQLLSSGGVLNKKGDEWYPSESYKSGAEISDMNVPVNIENYEDVKDFLRPVMVSLINCENILLDGPVFQNSPAWCIHPLMCENLTVRNIEVRNPWYSQNGDGIDIESCKNSLVYNCTFDVGDDAICIKSGKDEDGRERAMPTENTIIKNCVVFHGHGGVTVGSEMSGGVKNMHVSGCTFIGTDVGLRFKSNRGRGGVVENIYISDIDMLDIPTNAISFNLYYGGMSVSEMMEEGKDANAKENIPEVSDETPQFKDISIRNIKVKGAYQAIYLQGLPEMNLENVVLENLVMEAENGLFCMDAEDISIKNLKLITSKFPALSFYNVKNVSVEGLEISESDQSQIFVDGSKTENVTFGLNSEAAGENFLLMGDSVSAEAVKIN